MFIKVYVNAKVEDIESSETGLFLKISNEKNSASNNTLQASVWINIYHRLFMF